jgi:hypothetical protein
VREQTQLKSRWIYCPNCYLLHTALGEAGDLGSRLMKRIHFFDKEVVSLQ